MPFDIANTTASKALIPSAHGPLVAGHAHFAPLGLAVANGSPVSKL